MFEGFGTTWLRDQHYGPSFWYCKVQVSCSGLQRQKNCFDMETKDALYSKLRSSPNVAPKASRDSNSGLGIFLN